MNRLVLIAIVAAGCSSIVSDPCADGFHLAGGQCVAGNEAPDAGVRDPDDAGPNSNDAGPGSGGDGGPGVSCALPEILCDGECIDVSSDPDNCGACNRVCASGICEAGHCLGELSGHIVAIGHDYRSHNAAMARVLANAVALGAPHDVGVARWNGTADSAAKAGTTTAMTQAMASVGRPWHAVTIPSVPSLSALDGVDVLVVDAQTGNGAEAHSAGAAWVGTIDLFLQRGGVVVVLEGASGASHRFADGAALYTIADPIETTGMPALVALGSDALAQHVLSPYLADTTSVVFPGVTGVIVTPDGALVLHQTRY